MEINCIYRFIREFSISDILKRIQIAQILAFIFAFIDVTLLTNCESKERFYRPNLPEQLCSIGIIDVDDTSNYSFSFHSVLDIRNSMRYISFEKSSQIEYSDEELDPLRELSFRIYTESGDLFKYQTNKTTETPIKYEIPDSLTFSSGTTYFFLAKGNDLHEISAKITVPEPPLRLSLNSVNNETVLIYDHLECSSYSGISYAVAANISFSKNYEENQFYALLVDAKGLVGYELPFAVYSGPIEFTIRESNTQGFFAGMHGLSTFRDICENNGDIGIELYSTPVYFIEGNKIPEAGCNITIVIHYRDTKSPLYSLGRLRVKLLSIPEELFIFEKSLYTYNKISKDPFAEPVYLNGNINGGNGVFAICRSTSLEVDLY